MYTYMHCIDLIGQVGSYMGKRFRAAALRSGAQRRVKPGEAGFFGEPVHARGLHGHHIHRKVYLHPYTIRLYMHAASSSEIIHVIYPCIFNGCSCFIRIYLISFQNEGGKTVIDVRQIRISSILQSWPWKVTELALLMPIPIRIPIGVGSNIPEVYIDMGTHPSHMHCIPFRLTTWTQNYRSCKNGIQVYVHVTSFWFWAVCGCATISSITGLWHPSPAMPGTAHVPCLDTLIRRLLSFDVPKASWYKMELWNIGWGYAGIPIYMTCFTLQWFSTQDSTCMGTWSTEIFLL